MYKITMLYALTILYNYICQLFFNKVKKKSKREKNSSAIIMSQYGAYFLGKEWFSRSLTSVCLGQSFPGVCLAAWQFYSANSCPSLPNKSGKYGFIRAIWDSLELLVCSNVQPYLWEGYYFHLSMDTDAYFSWSILWDQCSKTEIWKKSGKKVWSSLHVRPVCQ